MSNRVAGQGEVFVCAVCGRLSKDRYGDQKIHPGWDSSCVTHSVLYRRSDLIINPRTGLASGVKEGAKSLQEPN